MGGGVAAGAEAGAGEESEGCGAEGREEVEARRQVFGRERE